MKTTAVTASQDAHFFCAGLTGPYAELDSPPIGIGLMRSLGAKVDELSDEAATAAAVEALPDVCTGSAWMGALFNGAPEVSLTSGRVCGPESLSRNRFLALKSTYITIYIIFIYLLCVSYMYSICTMIFLRMLVIGCGDLEGEPTQPLLLKGAGGLPLGRSHIFCPDQVSGHGSPEDPSGSCGAVCQQPDDSEPHSDTIQHC